MTNSDGTILAKDEKEPKNKFRYHLIWHGMAIGVFSGIVVVLFRLLLEHAGALLGSVLAFIKEKPLFIAGWFVVLAVLALIVTILLKIEPNISGSGIPQVEGEIDEQINQCCWRVLICKMLGGLIAIGAGLSVGREGPSIQLGAMVGKGFARFTKITFDGEEKLLMSCGAGSGLAAAFNAPFAGLLFALEELHKGFSTDLIIATLASCCTSDFVSRIVFGVKPVFCFKVQDMLPVKYLPLIIVLGVITGLAGVGYNYCTEKSQQLYDLIKPKYIRILIPFLLAGVFGLIYPAVLGGGHHLVLEANGLAFTLQAVVLLLIVKFLFSMISFGSGTPGGIFLPLLVMGALIGRLFGDIVPHIMGIDDNLIQYFIILGMAGFFCSIVRAPLTGIVLICEMTGGFSGLLPILLVALTSYVVADFCKAEPIYEQLLNRLVKNQSIKIENT